MTEKELLSGVLSKTVNLDEAGVAALYNADGSLKDDALTTILKLDGERVKTFKTDAKKLGDDQYSRGKRETMEALEKELRDEHGIKSEATGKELIAEILESKQGKSKPAKAAELTDDDVKKHPLFLKTETELKDKLTQAEADWKKKLDEANTGFTRERTLTVVKADAKALFDALNPVLSEDPARAKNQLRLFELELDGHDYQVEEKDGKRNILVLNKDGKRLEDDHGNVIKFEQFVRQAVESNYDITASEKRSTAGNPNEKQPPAGGANVKKAGAASNKPPKSFEEYAEQFRDIELNVPDLKERHEKLTALRESAKSEGVSV